MFIVLFIKVIICHSQYSGKGHYCESGSTFYANMNDLDFPMENFHSFIDASCLGGNVGLSGNLEIQFHVDLLKFLFPHKMG